MFTKQLCYFRAQFTSSAINHTMCFPQNVTTEQKNSRCKPIRKEIECSDKTTFFKVPTNKRGRRCTYRRERG